MTTPKNYTLTAKLFHWTMSILIITMLCLGWYMVSIEKRPDSGWYFDLHKSIGLIIGFLIVLRLLWRLGHKPPGLPMSVPSWQAKTARMIHWLLYLCLFLMPLTGFLGSSFSEYGVAFFGLPLPTWAHPDKFLSKQFFTIHIVTAFILATFISLHILAALKHLWINKDEIFQRMWF